MDDLGSGQVYAWLKIVDGDGNMVGLEKHAMFEIDAKQAVTRYPDLWSLTEWPRPVNPPHTAAPADPAPPVDPATPAAG